MAQKPSLSLKGRLHFCGLFITAFAWVDSLITQPLQLWFLIE
ncbi:hypothetical protein D047_4662 [Vibrio parahaemolyticus VPTS-2010_2]|nr:hypothetical protein D047_4662 [Vibrio parahaemolyticus VPTS-2010_2]